jgi:transposase InsO family protein
MVWRTGLSGVPPDSVRCTRVDQLELATFGFLEKPLRYNSPDCPVWHRTVRCASIMTTDRPLELLHDDRQADRMLELFHPHKNIMTTDRPLELFHPHKNIMTTDRPLELLHMDLFGPIAYISIGGSKYCLVIVDDYSRFTWVFFLQDKSQTQETLKGFLRRAQNEIGLRIKKIRSDNETEFKNSQIEGFRKDEGIKHEFSSPYTPQQKWCSGEEE